MRVDKKILSDHAVSPVVGVMLMLVVTIIIAAVVSAFAGGMASGKEKAPQVSLDCRITSGDSMMTGTAGPVFVMKHMGGDPVNTKNVKLVTSWVNATGIYNVQSTVAPSWNSTDKETYYSKGAVTGESNYTLSSLNTHYSAWGGEVYYNVPYLVIAGQTPSTGDEFKDTPLWFGNYVFKAGDVIKADTDNTVGGSVAGQNLATPIIKYGELLARNDIVNIKLIDLKSGTTIYDKNVNVEV